tara:strand:+ start:412 stop:1896 length:1485 start_codon:yes stop_codon:yes gene_type:complete
MNKVDDIIVVGGGNAGYISALILQSSFPRKRIGIIQSKKIGTVGVGESSSEHISDFCTYVGINKLDFILRAKATFKVGVYFDNWADEDFLHNINPHSPINSSVRSHFPYLQSVVVNNRPNYEMNIGGAWKNEVALHFFNNLNDTPTNQFHFDTYALNQYLREVCQHKGIKIIEDDIVGADIDPETGNISSVNGRIKYYSDFFIDCSGFSRLLLGKTLGVKWKSYSEYLPINSAIAFTTKEMDEYNMYTKATARDYGWSWQIPIQGRTGNGYVFCDRFIDEDQAHQEMEKVYNQKLDVVKTFKFDTGRMEKAWYKNCYGVGLSQSFVEPLEATAMGSVVQQMFAFVHYLPSYSIDECNQVVNDIFDNIFDFVQVHYLTKKEDTLFWRDVKNNLKLTPSLQNLLDKWKIRFPLAADVYCKWGMFTTINYIFILYGLKWFNMDVVANEFRHLSHLDLPIWGDTYPNVMHMKHKKFISEVVRIYNLNHENRSTFSQVP